MVLVDCEQMSLEFEIVGEFLFDTIFASKKILTRSLNDTVFVWCIEGI